MSLNTDIKHVAIHAKDEILKLRMVAHQKEEQVVAKLRSAVEDRDYAKERAQSFATVLLETLDTLRKLDQQKQHCSNDAQEDIAKKIRAEEILRKYADEKAIAFTNAEIEASRRVRVIEEELRILREQNQKERDRLLVPALASVRGVYRRYREEYMRETDRIVAKHDSIIADFKKHAADRLAEYNGVMADYERRLTEAIQSDAPLMEFQFPIPEARSAVPELSMEKGPVVAVPVSVGGVAVAEPFLNARDDEDMVFLQSSEKPGGDGGGIKRVRKAEMPLSDKEKDEISSFVSGDDDDDDQEEKDGSSGSSMDEERDSSSGSDWMTRFEFERDPPSEPDEIRAFVAHCRSKGFIDAVEHNAWWNRRYRMFKPILYPVSGREPPFFRERIGQLAEHCVSLGPSGGIFARSPDSGPSECWICGIYAVSGKDLCLCKNIGDKRDYFVGDSCVKFVQCMIDFFRLVKKNAYPSKSRHIIALRLENMDAAMERLCIAIACLYQFPDTSVRAPSGSSPKRAKPAQGSE